MLSPDSPGLCFLDSEDEDAPDLNNQRSRDQIDYKNKKLERVIINSKEGRKLNNKRNVFKNSELLHNYILTLPTNNYFLENDIKKICSIINKREI